MKKYEVTPTANAVMVLVEIAETYTVCPVIGAPSQVQFAS
jgi:hypothetical protein